MKRRFLVNVGLLSLSLTSLAMEAPDKLTTPTPCPFINSVLIRMIKEKKLSVEDETIGVDELVDVSEQHFGVNRTLMKTLALARANDGYLDLADLLDPNKLPAHRGSLARADSVTAEEFAQIDEVRLDVLMTDDRFSSEKTSNGKTERYISLAQLEAFQTEHCWKFSDMSCAEKITARAEVHLLWSLVGAYRISFSGEDVIPLRIIDDLLRKSTLPENFQKNNVDPATLLSTLFAGLLR